MSAVVWILGVLILIVWFMTLADLFRRHAYSGWALVGWIALIIILPFIGSVIYWAVRKPTGDEVEQARMAEADTRRSAGARPFDHTGTG
jgi:type VI protein secretion system component VasK